MSYNSRMISSLRQLNCLKCGGDITLSDLFIKHGSCKGTPDNHPHYAPLYERYLAGRRVRSLLELGVALGKSLAVWLDYFPEATVYGVDHRDVEAHRVQHHPRCRVLKADQCDAPFLKKLAAEAGDFDVIIDDASHDPVKQAISLRILWDHVRPGGLYVIEDLETSYWGVASWDQDALGPAKVEGYEHPMGVMPLLKSLCDGLTAKYAGQRAERFPLPDGLLSVEFHPNVVFLTKSHDGRRAEGRA